MKTYRLTIAYDGTEFHGWQRQPGPRTVQGLLEEGVRGLLGPDAGALTGAGRTDAGVHARGQVATFRAETRMRAAALAPALNARLPQDVRVLESAAAPEGFDARRSALARRYTYRLLDREDPLLGRFAVRPRARAEAAALERATRPLEGAHDFSSFRSVGSTEGPPLCEVRRARWREWEGGLLLDIEADRFLYHMVRAIVGTVLREALAADPEGSLRAVLEARDRARAGPTAPARGLCLEEVRYPEVHV